MELKFANNADANKKYQKYLIHFHHPGQFNYPTDVRDKISYKTNQKLFIQIAHDVR